MATVDISTDHPRYFDAEKGHSVFRVRLLFRKRAHRCRPPAPFDRNGRWNEIIQ